MLNSFRNAGETFSVPSQRFDKFRIERSLQLFEFDVITINAQGQQIRQERGQAKYFTEDLGNGVTLDLVTIPSGEFMMGSLEGEEGSRANEYPQHLVTIKSFFISKYPVTQSQWWAVSALPKVNFNLKPHPSRFTGDNHPVERVSWHDAVEFCARLSIKTGSEYCLPSEAEWEYACRAGSTTPFHFGDTITSYLANYRGTTSYANAAPGEYRGATTPVGSFHNNAFGLYDLHGQVWEWCADSWHDDYEDAPTNNSIWQSNDNNDYHILRGGSWYDIPVSCRSACRVKGGRGGGLVSNVGFRVVCTA
ncbi:MAG: formylglycine-generating enzyme family protein [Nostoc sp.]|uniref:formylglycine-generating enzyme family protein n=1 Tax=Nostoc sp. TaxID=1180 RepID=UPI002FF2C6A1